MAKKHRVKRQKYVEHLLRLEKERDEYLAKRMRSKRSRAERNAEDIFGEAKENLTMGEMKRERKESAAKEQAVLSPNEQKEKEAVNASVNMERAENNGDIAALPAARKGMKRINRRY
ncbi:hypothetical protein C3747_121g217c [Trypanosoma cruzi]|uniref:Uncharacterized protein n=2 Tax=Trypanosoma cruzi TaxID=5693 RepID=Q4CT29_TRYCC|nr:hypothetical protein, conserved [Trypanosoma cruzi]EAN83431.1 hypothetical protein, conserved [Trypanosoma cruzi]PWV06028.1 hypothetical protein C3747_121g217c [Trypanosoma cruzi]RNC53948.1 hypothetical protein TcCL_ESM08678 [Trypanosoma cruzi]|eukprot:XP_805282.1 hypothetical protein [Trypanosoma cruzi strain CL Brener]